MNKVCLILKQISDETYAGQNSEAKSTESEGGSERFWILFFSCVHTDSKIDECREGDKKEEMYRCEDTET